LEAYEHEPCQTLEFNIKSADNSEDGMKLAEVKTEKSAE
jgi:hypothetical protein